MIAIRKFGWSVLVLAAFAGCGTQENGPATPATPGQTETAPTPGDVPPPAASTTETAPAPAPSTEPGKGAATTPDMPKDAPEIQAPQPTPATKDDAKPQDKSAAVSLTSEEVAEIFEVISQLHRLGTSVLLAEQNARMALSVAEFAYVIESGLIVKQASAAALADDDAIRAANLGGA